VQDGGGHIGTLVQFPDDLGTRDIALATGTDGERAVGIASADGVDDSGIGEGRGAHVPIDAGVGVPEGGAFLGIERGNLSQHGNDNFSLAGWGGNEHWGMPRLIDAAGAPDLAAGGFVEGDEGFALDAGIDEEPILVKDRGRRGTPAVEGGSDRGLPELLAGMIEGEHTGFPEKRIDAVGVGGRGAGGVAVILTDPILLGQCGGDGRVPEKFAIGKIQAEQMALEFALVGGSRGSVGVPGMARQVNAIAEDNGAGRTGAWERGFPSDARVVAPGQGNALDAAFASGTRAAELGPV